MNEIQALENKYGLMLFRMGLTHLVDVGVRHLTDETVAETIAQITAKGEADKVDGTYTIMTPEFQCQIVRCSAELARFSPWELFRYIKQNVHLADCE